MSPGARSLALHGGLIALLFALGFLLPAYQSKPNPPAKLAEEKDQ